MSHVAQVELEIKDEGCMKAAAAELGLEYVEEQKEYKWHGRSMGDGGVPAGFTVADLGHCDRGVLRLTDAKLAEVGATRKSCYELGVVTRRDGKPGMALLADFWSGGYGLEAAVGANAGLFRQTYAKHVAIKKARMQGFAVTQNKLQDGSIQLVCTKN